MSKVVTALTVLAVASLLAPLFAADGLERRRGADDRDNETDDLEIEIVAPLEAIDIVGRTITVLGTQINVKASASASASAAALNRKKGEDDGGTDPLPDLMPSQWVKVSFLNDSIPLTALEVKAVEAYEQSLKVQGPLQAVDLDAGTIMLLGLVIEISSASIEGADDHGTDVVIATPASFFAGQSIEVALDKDLLPDLNALDVDIKNFTNSVRIEFQDKHGQPISAFTEDVSVVVSQTAATQTTAGKLLKKPVQFRTITRAGIVSVPGMIPGRANIMVTRLGKFMKKTLKIAPNVTMRQIVKLRN